MKHYIGIKMVEALPGDKNGVAGYNIIYPDGYASWSPKDIFEAAYLPITLPNSLVAADIDQLLAQVQTSPADDRTTIVRAELLTGFSLFEISSCVSPENYDQQLGTDMAVNKIRSKLWFLMGFVLRWARYGLNHTPVHLEEIENKGDDNGNLK